MREITKQSKRSVKNYINIIKQTRKYYYFCRYCYWGGGWNKAIWVYENRIKPLQKEHPFLCWIGSWII